jgi:branched-chain amino acid transport system permease protein
VEVFVQQVTNGLTLGSVYALLAIGFSLIFGVLNLVTFAHGEVYMVGAFAGLLVLWLMPWNIPLALAVGLGASFLMGLLVERVSFRPFRGAPHMTTLLSTIGVSITLQNAVILLLGPETKSLPDPLQLGHTFIGASRISNLQILIIAVSIAVVIVLTAFIDRSRTGRAMRAVSQDLEIARLMGVPSVRIIALAFAIGSGLAGMAGVLIGLYYNAFYPLMGVQAGLKAFAATVLGGLGSVPGAVLGGLILGLAEVMTAAYLDPSYRDVIGFVILVIVLIFRPRGLMGKRSI